VLRDILAGRDDVTVLDAPQILGDALRAATPPDATDPRPDPGPGVFTGEVPGLRSPGADGRYAQFWPHRHGTDAIFLALLRRT
jgi:16S rRNA C967 or C1407 C5-methylase (RsmB/RsmF family)